MILHIKLKADITDNDSLDRVAIILRIIFKLVRFVLEFFEKGHHLLFGIVFADGYFRTINLHILLKQGHCLGCSFFSVGVRNLWQISSLDVGVYHDINGNIINMVPFDTHA